MIGEINFVVPCDIHMRGKFVKMKMMADSTKQNVEDHVSYIMEDILGTETKPWHKKIEDCCRKSCHMCNDLNAEEGSSYKICHLKKKTKMSH